MGLLAHYHSGAGIDPHIEEVIERLSTVRAGHIIDANVIHLWRGNELADTDDLIDATGNLDLGIISTPLPLAGLIDGARDYDGSTDGFETADQTDQPDLLGDWTIEAWIRPDAVQSGAIAIYVGIGSTLEIENQLLSLEIFDGGGALSQITCGWEFGGAGAGNGATSPDVVPNSVWSHIAARKSASGTILELFYNGKMIHRVTGLTNATGGTSANCSWAVGTLSNGQGRFYDGDIDEVRFSKVARTNFEIEESYRRGALLYRVLEIIWSEPMLGLDVAANYAINNGVVVESIDSVAADRQSAIINPSGLVSGQSYELTAGANITDDLVNAVAPNPFAFLVGQGEGGIAPDAITAKGQGLPPSEFSGAYAASQLGSGGGPPPGPTTTYLQRIWDTVLAGGSWVQYSKTTLDNAPLSGETQPNHTDNIVASTHQVIGES